MKKQDYTALADVLSTELFAAGLQKSPDQVKQTVTRIANRLSKVLHVCPESFLQACGIE